MKQKLNPQVFRLFKISTSPLQSSALESKSPNVFQFCRWELEFWLAFICISPINWEALLWSICLWRLPVPSVFVPLLKFALMTNTEISHKYMLRILTLAFSSFPFPFLNTIRKFLHLLNGELFWRGSLVSGIPGLTCVPCHMTLGNFLPHKISVSLWRNRAVAQMV